MEHNIGWAVEQMWAGNKVRRAGWNGTGMWIVLMPRLDLPPHTSQTPGASRLYILQSCELHSQPYIAMWTAKGLWQPGWLCSQADLLSTDWELA
jgi:hypothetical protein